MDIEEKIETLKQLVRKAYLNNAINSRNYILGQEIIDELKKELKI